MPYSFLVTQPKLLAQSVIAAMLGWLITCSLATGERPLPAKPPGAYFPLHTKDHQAATSFRHGQPILGTTYFYWYDIASNQHIFNRDGSDALTTHPADMQGLSYQRMDWHINQLRDMVAAGIDFLMPVYWGVPGKYNSWSFTGLPPLVAAHDALIKEGVNPPAIGLFYDSSILQYNSLKTDESNFHIDLRTEFGKTYFYQSVRDFFSLIPPQKWARVDGKPIVFLYTAMFAKAQSADQFTDLRRRFKKDFGVEPFIVKMRDWQGDTDATYQWGGSVHLQVDTHVAALGPGYDHTAVPGRRPRIVSRHDGRTYVDSWSQLLRQNPDRRPWMVHVETWNEWHEGTDIAASKEYGRSYIVLTRLFSNLWHANLHVNQKGPYTDAEQVSWDLKHSHGLIPDGQIADGIWKQHTFGEISAIVSEHNQETPGGRYLYFSVDDSFAFDLTDTTMQLTIVYRDAGCDSFHIQYDNVDPDRSVLDGAFRSLGNIQLKGSGKWLTATFTLPACRFANRCNHADFRLVINGGARKLAVSQVMLRRR